MDVTTIASISMQNDLFRISCISQNIANVLTPGYKKQIPVVSDFSMRVAAGLAGSVSMASHVPLPITTSSIDATAGAFRYTANPQDVAIEGDTFFEVKTSDGLAYTRQGNLHVDIQGRLVGSQDLPVMGRGGEIVLTNAPFTIAPNGDIQQADLVVANLKRVRFESPSTMVARGDGLYDQGGARMIDDGSQDSLRPGFQEGSNVSSSQEMVRLTETVRHFESLQKIVQGYDETLGNTIRKLGEF